MVKTIIFYHPTSQIHHHHHLPLLTLCGKRVKQFKTVRSGRFESNLLTWPGRPNTHVWGPSHPHDFSPFFPGCGSGSPTSTTRIHATVDAGSWAFLHPHVAAWEQRSKRVRVKSTRRANQVLKLTDYHISRHVVSTFKSLTSTTTHCGLIHFH